MSTESFTLEIWERKGTGVFQGIGRSAWATEAWELLAQPQTMSLGIKEP